MARLVERITRNFGENRLTGPVFLDVAQAFDTVWIDGLLWELTVLNFPSYIVHTISSCLRGRTFEASFQTATSSRRSMRAGVAQGGLISPVLLSLYVNDMLSPTNTSCCPTTRRRGHHTHVPQADAVHKLPGVIPQRSSTVVEWTENRH